LNNKTNDYQKKNKPSLKRGAEFVVSEKKVQKLKEEKRSGNSQQRQWGFSFLQGFD
jgi:hypothetical protein